MKGTMPAMVNIAPGSWDTREAEGTAVQPLSSKKSIQRFAISCESMSLFSLRDNKISKSFGLQIRGLGEKIFTEFLISGYSAVGIMQGIVTRCF